MLNLFPRSFLQRVAGWAVPVVGLLYIGKGKECPLCGCRRRKFLPYGYVSPRENALCPNCLALERHRLLWLWLLRESDLGRGAVALPRLLHIAPEASLMRHFKRLYRDSGEYITADLESPLDEIKSNHMYSYDLTITKLGSDSPDVPVDESVVTYTAVTGTWIQHQEKEEI